MTAPLVVHNVKVHFATPRGTVRALDGVSFSLDRGEIVGVVGESGCGKSTLAKTIVGLQRPSSGSVEIDGNDLLAASRRVVLQKRRQIQMVFQDPFGSLNPRLSIGRILSEPFIVHGLGTCLERQQWVSELIEQVGLASDSLTRRPHEFSGGQRQRICIARALALKPSVIVCDEAVSALDVSVQAQILNLLLDLRKSADLSYVFISHDLSVIHYMSDRVMVMYLGEVVELAPADALWMSPYHPYAMRLLSAVDRRKTAALKSNNDEVPSQINPPAGCPFHPRCPFAKNRCHTEKPMLRQISDRRWAACHYAGDIG